MPIQTANPSEAANELERFAELQLNLAPMFRRLFPNPLAPRTVLVVPSLSLDTAELSKIAGVTHYEERMLCMLLLLRLPRTRLIYITSQSIDPVIIDYYLHLLPGIPSGHARQRLVLFDCHDASLRPLSQKILERPRLLQRLREALPDPSDTHMVCFSVSPLERSLAVQLGVPIYGCDPHLSDLGSKSGSREVFRAAGIAVPDGVERLRDDTDLIDALEVLKRRNPGLRRAVVKLNEGFSGEGNAVFDFTAWSNGINLASWIKQSLPQYLRFEAGCEHWQNYRSKLAEMGGVVESFIEGAEVRSPSVQCRIDPLGGIELISTHEQVLGGPSGQIFQGCEFPAKAAYRAALHDAGLRVAEVLRQRGVLGRFGVDFMALRDQDQWRLQAIEINLRKGGTTHTYMMLQYLSDGRYDVPTGQHLTPSGQARYYYATDNLQQPAYNGLAPEDLIDIAVENGLHFNSTSQQGVVFHLIGALSEFGKLGTVCVSDSRTGARRLYDDTITALNRAAGDSSI